MVFTDVGVSKIIDFLANTAATPPGYLAYGTDSTAETTSDTTLGAEVDREALDTTTSATPIVRYVFLLPTTDANGQNLREAGLFDAVSSGNMYVRFTHSLVAKTSSIEVEYEVTVKVLN
jgi:hypothetical protein